MKKIIAIVMTVAVLATLGVIAFAETTAEPVDPLPEESAPVEGAPVTEDEKSEKLDTFMEAVGSGTFWTTAVSILATLAGCIALFKNKFEQITAKIGKAATADHLTAQVGSLADEIKKTLGDRTEAISGNITAMMDDYKLLLTCFTIFIESAKINANAKKEILDRLTGIKAISDNVTEDVAEALEAIKEANAAEPPVLTPKTDKALEAAAENNSAMILD